MRFVALASHVMHVRGVVRVAECFGACGCRHLYVLDSPRRRHAGYAPSKLPRRVRCDGGHFIAPRLP